MNPTAPAPKPEQPDSTPRKPPRGTWIDLGGRKIQLFIQHEHVNTTVRRTHRRRLVRVKAITHARIEDETGDTAIEEQACCSEHDQFVRKTGVRTALTRLLADPMVRSVFGLDKPARTKIWNRVWNTKK